MVRACPRGQSPGGLPALALFAGDAVVVTVEVVLAETAVVEVVQRVVDAERGDRLSAGLVAGALLADAVRVDLVQLRAVLVRLRRGRGRCRHRRSTQDDGGCRQGRDKQFLQAHV